jgi:hypothetical protein
VRRLEARGAHASTWRRGPRSVLGPGTRVASCSRFRDQQSPPWLIANRRRAEDRRGPRGPWSSVHVRLEFRVRGLDGSSPSNRVLRGESHVGVVLREGAGYGCIRHRRHPCFVCD